MPRRVRSARDADTSSQRAPTRLAFRVDPDARTFRAVVPVRHTDNPAWNRPEARDSRRPPPSKPRCRPSRVHPPEPVSGSGSRGRSALPPGRCGGRRSVPRSSTRSTASSSARPRRATPTTPSRLRRASRRSHVEPTEARGSRPFKPRCRPREQSRSGDAWASLHGSDSAARSTWNRHESRGVARRPFLDRGAAPEGAEQYERRPANPTSRPPARASGRLVCRRPRTVLASDVAPRGAKQDGGAHRHPWPDANPRVVPRGTD